MRLGKGKKRALARLGFILSAFFLLLLAIPLWLPWILRPVAASRGLQFSSYKRSGYGRFSLNQVTFTNEHLQFTANDADLLTPFVWAWRSYSPSRDSEPLRINDWTLSVTSHPEKPQPVTKPSSPYTNVLQVQKVVGELCRWLPSAKLTNGKILLGNNEVRLQLISWKDGQLTTTTELPAHNQRATLQADLTRNPYKVQVRSDTAELNSDFNLDVGAAGIDLKLAGTWQTNRIDAEAHFDRENALPQTASVAARDFRISAPLLGLRDYDTVNGSAQLTWTNGRLACLMRATGAPLAEATNDSPIEIDVRASGDTNAATIESGAVSLGWLQIHSSPVTRLHFNGPLLQEPADLSLRADFSQQSWIPLHGVVQGSAKLKSIGEKYPAVSFLLTGTNVGIPTVEATRLLLSGNARWPLITIKRLQAILDDSSSVAAEGTINYALKTITNCNLSAEGRAAARWLPAGYGFETAKLNVSASGPLTNLVHRGQFSITDVTLAGITPVQAQLDWHGHQTSIHQASAKVRSRDSAIDADFSIALGGIGNMDAPVSLAATLDSLSWRQTDTPVFTLTKPAHFSFEGNHSLTGKWRAKVDGFELKGNGGRIQVASSVEWPNGGNIRFAATNIDSDRFGSLMKAKLEPTKLHTLFLTAGWSNGPLVFALSADAETKLQNRSGADAKTNRLWMNLADLGTISAKIGIHGDEHGVALTNFSVQNQSSPIAVAHGFVPVAVVPAARTNFVQINSKQQAEFFLVAHPQSTFWQKFSEWTGVTLEQPYISAQVAGTWENPHGTVRIKAADIRLPKERFRVPDLGSFDVNIGLDREVAILTNLSLLVQKQPVTAHGSLPLGESFWADLKEKKLPNWQKASGQLRINDAQIAAFSALFPALLAPEGSFGLDVALEPGGNLSGELLLKQARTRPLPSIGPIRDIDVALRFTQRQLRLAQAEVSIGGSPVNASGAADLSGTEWLRGIPPPFEFALYGSNVPLSRRPESIIRSDLKVSIKKTNNAPPLISGMVRLHDSYYLSAVADLVPGKVATPEHRPPYFSVTEPNLADWRLALRVGGERGMRVRSTLFNGQVSPNLRLQGTLKEPVALGDIKIDEGTVKFPFANLQVQRGYVTLTSENPYRPQLIVSAASKQFGYDVRMEITGPANKPVIQFSSTPPLSSEQLVLMVTAGELPRTGYTLSPSQRAQTMALFLGKDLLSKLGFGDQSVDRLSFSSGQEISETGRPTYSLEYKLAARWSLVGEYDRFNAFNAGVKWKVYSK